jgi:threonine dehydrogenase-like Zn-dependent dehydrogenase
VLSTPATTSEAVDANVSTGAEAGPISAPMVAALEGAWAAIRAQHPEVPAVVVVLGAGSIGTAGGLRLGHFAAMRWAGPDQQSAMNRPGVSGDSIF